jgi:acyl-CoA dehydrogenase
MDFALSPRAEELRKRLGAFMDECVYPNEARYQQQIADSGDPHFHAPVLDELKVEARERRLWNLFLPHETEWTEGLSNLDYAPLAEMTGRSPLTPEALNCSAPDTGNMELLTMFGTDQQKERWLRPLLEGEIRSCFAMTEPAVASSDATNISLRIERDDDHYVLNGHKWWISGAARERCRVAIVMGKTDPDAPPHRQQSMVLVPMDTPGLENVRSLPVFGYQDNEGHCELVFEDVRVPADHLLGEEGGGFAMSQARLGPGRIHHCMRAVGVAERALELMCRRVRERTAFGKPLAEQGVIQQWIADSRIEIEQARLADGHGRQQGRPHRDLGDQGRRPRRGPAGHRPGHPGPRRPRRVERRPAGVDVRTCPHLAVGRRSRRGAPHVGGTARASKVRGGIRAE